METTSHVRPHARPRSRAAHHAARIEERQEVKKFWSRAEGYAKSNRIAAQIIVADVERYGGECAGLVICARLTLKREAEKQAAAA